MNNVIHGMAKLTDLGVIRVHGDEAAKFLQGQLTQDFALLGPSQARLAGYCSAKGRLLASFVGFKRDPSDIVLLCSRDLLATTLKRLSMYVMRAKLTLSDASAAFVLRGLVGDAAAAFMDPAQPPWTRGESGVASVIALYPALGLQRALWVAPLGADEPVAAPLSAEAWQWTQVRSGVAMVTLPIVDALVPQMLNYESVGGVNFKKGCYPGQEVVARSQFRGTLKRRTYLVHGDAPMAAGQELFHSADTQQPCGVVAQAAAAPTGGFDALVAVQTAATESGELHLGQSQGPVLQLLELPYPLLVDI